jgi:hypothetical protein
MPQVMDVLIEHVQMLQLPLFQILIVKHIYQTANVSLKLVVDVLQIQLVPTLQFLVHVLLMPMEQFVSGIQLVLVHVRRRPVFLLQAVILMMLLVQDI